MEVLLDQRLGNNPKYYLGEKNEGLMLVPDEIRKCVVFVAYKNKYTKADSLAGTAFFMSIKEEEDGLNFIYLITARHVIEGIAENSMDGKVYLRINRKNKSYIVLHSDLNQWKYHPISSTPQNKVGYVDVAALAWAPDTEIYDCRFIPYRMAINDDLITKHGIGCGDELFITGLFNQHVGLKRNLPIIRIGNIACMPEEPVETLQYGPIDAYLAEVRSIGGLSGSPVFVNLGAVRIFNGETKLATGTTSYLLGLIHGHFDLKMLECDELSVDNLMQLKINMGIAIVIPVSKILEVLNQEEFVKMRKRENEQYKLKNAPTPDSA